MDNSTISFIFQLALILFVTNLILFLMYYFGSMRKLVQLYRVEKNPDDAKLRYFQDVSIGQFPINVRTTLSTVGASNSGLYISIAPVFLGIPSIVVPWHSIVSIKCVRHGSNSLYKLFIGKPTVSVIRMTRKALEIAEPFHRGISEALKSSS